jgi:hypothetical protein
LSAQEANYQQNEDAVEGHEMSEGAYDDWWRGWLR